MADQFLLNDSDRALIQNVLRLSRSRRVNVPQHSQQVPSSQSPELYVAKSPASGIPARVGTRPGSATCEIYRLSDTDDPLEVDLEDALFQVTVYNVTACPVTRDDYLLTWRDKFGKWVCIPGGCQESVLLNDPSCPNLITIPDTLYATLTFSGIVLASSIPITNSGGTIWSGYDVFCPYDARATVNISLSCAAYTNSDRTLTTHLLQAAMNVNRGRTGVDGPNWAGEVVEDVVPSPYTPRGTAVGTYSYSPFSLSASGVNTYPLTDNGTLDTGPWCGISPVVAGAAAWTLDITE